MKIIFVHNFYGSSAPSGENTVFLAERDLLRGRGHQVLEFTRHSDEIRNQGFLGSVKGAFSTPWNSFSVSDIRRLLKHQRPDVLHAHNTFPLLSPAIFHAARDLGVATVLTLHNYRLFCAAGIPMRNGRPCTACLDRNSVLPALHNGCYRNSRIATLPMALMIALHRRLQTWKRHLDTFIALSDFQKSLMADAGLPREAIQVKPQFYPNPPDALPWNQREEKAVFIGRLSEEKGIQVLLQAWKAWGSEAPLLEIIGDGPLRNSLVKSNIINHRITFAGQLPFDETQQRLSRARLLVLPSLCFEGFPMVVREAFALGVPVAASRIGPLPDIVKPGIVGVVFEPGNAEDLLETGRAVWINDRRLSDLAVTSRKEFEEKYTAEANYKMLMDIYEKAMTRRRQREGQGR